MSHPHDDAPEYAPNDFDSGSGNQASDSTEFTSADLRRWIDIRGALRAIPIGSCALHEAVMPQVVCAQPAESSESWQPASEASGISGRVATVASLAALLVVGLFTSVAMNRISQQRELALQVAARSAFLDGVRETNQSDWQVVVVNVPEEDCARIRGKITESVVNKGLMVESMNSGIQDASLNSPDVFVSTRDTALEVLRAVEFEIQDSAGEMTAGPPEQFDRDELVLRFKESMESPTESDRYFGEMLVIHADTGSVKISAEPVAEAIVKSEVGDTQNPAADSSMSTNSLRATVGNRSEKHRPVLVVLVRKKTAPAGPQSDSSSNPGSNQFAASLITG